jgi:hypothetical protein
LELGNTAGLLYFEITTLLYEAQTALRRAALFSAVVSGTKTDVPEEITILLKEVDACINGIKEAHLVSKAIKDFDPEKLN